MSEETINSPDIHSWAVFSIFILTNLNLLFPTLEYFGKRCKNVSTKVNIVNRGSKIMI